MEDEDSKLVEFFRKVGEGVMNPKNPVDSVKESASNLKSESGQDREIPSFLQGFFEKREAGWPEYVVLKMQLSMIFLYIFSILFVLNINWSVNWILGTVSTILGLYILYLTMTEIRDAFPDDFKAYRGFISMLLVLVIFLVLIVKFFPYNISSSSYIVLVPPALVLAGAISGFTIFRMKYGRNYTYGTVEKLKGSKAVVKTNYDIKSNLKQGTHLLETIEDVEPGEKVKVKVERNVLGLRGSEPKTVLEKA